MTAKLRVGVYGANGHQVHRRLVDHPRAELAAAAGLPAGAIPSGAGSVREVASLDELLRMDDVRLVSLCSPRRATQAADAIRCMEAGKHVYAEKPCSLTEADLDRIVATADRTGMRFHEMAVTVCESPYRQMRALIGAGAIGSVVQVLAQKCYPWHDRRPADEETDGGLTRQVGIYVLRFVEHIAGERVSALDIRETRLGNPRADGDCRMAVAMSMTLRNGGVASGVCNYLNPMREVCWGYEVLRVFGTGGIVESSSDDGRLRLIRLGRAPEVIDTSDKAPDYFDLYIDHLLDGSAMPLTQDEELSPTRWVIRAKAPLAH